MRNPFGQGCVLGCGEGGHSQVRVEGSTFFHPSLAFLVFRAIKQKSQVFSHLSSAHHRACLPVPHHGPTLPPTTHEPPHQNWTLIQVARGARRHPRLLQMFSVIRVSQLRHQTSSCRTELPRRSYVRCLVHSISYKCQCVKHFIHSLTRPQPLQGNLHCQY